MLELRNKTATMGQINNRLEKHGEESVTAFDIPLDLLLDIAQLDALVEHASAMLFDDKRDVLHPAFPQFESFKLRDAIAAKNAAITIGAGAKPYEIAFTDVRMKSLELTPATGGETQLHLILQVRPESKHLAKLIDAQETQVKFSFSAAELTPKNKRQQQDLPLEKSENSLQANAKTRAKREPKAPNGEGVEAGA